MDSSLDLPHTGVGTADLPELARSLEQPGPFATLVVATDANQADAEQRFDALLRDAHRDLHGRGAPADMLDAMADAMRPLRTDNEGVACVATPRGVVTAASGPLPRAGIAAWDSLPRLSTFIEWHQSSPPALMVLVDRTGADIFAAGVTLPVDVVGTDGAHDVRKSAPGGWSQRRYQRRAENEWQANAGDVATAVTARAQEVDARLIVVAGDERAVGLVLDDLPELWKSLVRVVEGGRGKGSDGDLEGGAARWYRTAVAEDTVALVRRLEEQLGRRDRGITGIDSTVAALAEAAVDTLLLHDDPADARRLFFRESDPRSISAAEAGLEGLDLHDGRAADVFVRAAWAGGAVVRIVPELPTLTEGVGALLRHRVVAGARR